MKAMRIHRLGEPLKLDEVEDPDPGPGEALIDVHACALNFADTLLVEGRYQERFDLPFAPGMEICGTIRALGRGAEGPAPGTRVAAYTGHGGFAEAIRLPATDCVEVPDGMPDTEAAAFLIAYSTSLVALQRAGLSAGETLLVLGAAGGVGLTAVELGKLLGATVIASARGADKLRIAQEAGADHLIDSATADLRAEVKALGGADVVYDPVGGEQFTAALRACRPRARMLPLGFASGEIPQLHAHFLLVKNISVIGFYWGGLAKLQPDLITDSFRQLFAWYGEGRLRPHVSHVLPLADANEALDLLRQRRATGKVVLTMPRLG